MKHSYWLGLIALYCAVSGARADAVIEGIVKLPPPKTTAAKAARYKAAATVGKPEKPVAVVYLEGDFPAASGATARPEIEQHNLQFSPGVLPVRVGTAVSFPNNDDEFHNVVSYSKAKTFDLGRYRKDEKPPPVVFDKAGEVELGCEIHEHMRATILVLETPYFCKTDEAGTYRLGNLPAGKYTLKVWINSRTTWSKPVELKDGETLKVDFAGPASATDISQTAH